MWRFVETYKKAYEMAQYLIGLSSAIVVVLLFIH